MSNISTSTESAYREFLRGIQPYVIGLNHCESTLDRTRWLTAPEGAAEERALKTDYRVDRIFDDAFDITATFAVTIRSLDQKSGQTGSMMLSISCSFWGHFHAAGAVSEAMVKRFSDSEARIVFTPYLRQFVSDLTSRMSIPPVLLPLAIGSLPSGGQQGQKSNALTKKSGKRTRKER